MRRTSQPPRGAVANRAVRFGDLLRRYRASAGLTQLALAQRAGVSIRGINALECGHRQAPHANTITRLADALDLAPADRAALEVAARHQRQPRERALVLFARPQTGMRAAAFGAAPVVVTPLARQHNLPIQQTSLLGRERELAELTALLRQKGTRLVTLTGPGGVGKTRLALEAAWALYNTGDVFPAGVWLVRLAPLTDPSLVIPTIAQTLGLNESGGAPLADQLRGFLRDKALLLLLDNFEHIDVAAPQVVELLESSVGLTLLVTSRGMLHVRGERNYPVSLLAVPPTTRGHIAVERLDHYGATALFLQRARAIQPDYPVTEATAPLIAEICARLNGLPLGIELAATWSRMLSPAALLARLERLLPVVTAGPVDLPERQQTMRATIAWSHDLLNAEGQRLFWRLAVFVDGWTVEAAGVICQPADETPMDQLAGLGTLLDQSLISQRAAEDVDGATGSKADDEPRFEMLHIVREFALERLEESGEAEAIRRAHARYMLAFAEGAEPGLRGADEVAWLRAVKRELGNVRAALEWARAVGEVELGLRIATALWRFWYEGGYLSEGQQWVESLLALAPSEESRGADSPASSIPTWLRARALAVTGMLMVSLRNVGPAEPALEAGLTLAREAGDWLATAMAHVFLGAIARYLGDTQRSVACYREALAVGRARDDPMVVYNAIRGLATCALAENRLADATALFTEGLAVSRAANHEKSAAKFLMYLGEVALWRREAQGAASLLQKALEAFLGIGWSWEVTEALELMAVACYHTGKEEQGARLLGAAWRLRETRNWPFVAVDQPRRDALVAPVRAELSAGAWAPAFAAGQALTLEETYAEALAGMASQSDGERRGDADLGAPTAGASAAGQEIARGVAERLTPRELEVLRLLAQGWKDAQIAAHLVISPRTVNHHITAIYGKLGVSSRAAATRIALERRLL